MATYKELKAQMAELEAQAAMARAAEFQEVLAEIRAKVADYGFTEQDIFGRASGRPTKRAKSGAPARYRDPKTGATWSGRGRAPSWIKDAKNRDRFLIGSQGCALEDEREV
ncbi:H-NS family nucleoid-associated regulatory protein [Paraburkholderia sp. EG304]|uniref:H-NS histone family protein n=1 Tax=Paraburkholderia sp. EG304 TaxID=3237015 RepID=UPI003977ED82